MGEGAAHHPAMFRGFPLTLLPLHSSPFTSLFTKPPSLRYSGLDCGSWRFGTGTVRGGQAGRGESGEAPELGDQVGLIAVAEVGGEGGPIHSAALGRTEDIPEANHSAEGLGCHADMGREAAGQGLAGGSPRRLRGGTRAGAPP